MKTKMEKNRNSNTRIKTKIIGIMRMRESRVKSFPSQLDYMAMISFLQCYFQEQKQKLKWKKNRNSTMRIKTKNNQNDVNEKERAKRKVLPESIGLTARQ